MIDLSSDTATKPTPEMRRAIAGAEVGDEQRGEDPTVNRLLAMVAELLGKEAALFLPSGTMCNLISVKVHTRPGDAVLLDRRSHTLRLESGGASFVSGVQPKLLDGEGGRFTPEQVGAAITRGDVYEAPTTLLIAEQTHNLGGGTVWPVEQLGTVCAVAQERGLATHLDGARLLNAAVATGQPARRHASPFDSVWIDFTKGLGAPMGAVLAGSESFVEEARRHKHIFGGALRQAGIVAAGCVYALEHHVERLAEDHENARLLHEGLAEIPGLDLDGAPETNMVFFGTEGTGVPAEAFLARLRDHGVRMGTLGTKVRAVTHLGVSPEDVRTAVEAARASLAGERRS